MSGNPDDERLEELRKQKMEEMQDQQAQEEAQQQAQQQADAQKQALLRQNLTDGARKRLNSVRMSKPQFAEQVERQVVALAQSGRLNGKIDEDKMKQILQEMKPDKKSFNIKRR